MMKEKIKRFLLYAGAEKESYSLAKPDIITYNRKTVVLISGCATLLIAGMLMSTLYLEGVKSNQIVYAIGFAATLTIFILSCVCGKRHEWMVSPLMYGASFVYYAYGMLIGAITDPGQKNVTFMVMLVFLPVVFIDQPLHTILSSGGYICIYILMCLHFKTGAARQNDVINSVMFGILGLIVGLPAAKTKIENYILAAKLHKVSRYDQLTQMKNRSSYELDLDSIPAKAKKLLACVYIDVNGLHELNNSKGHAAGDQMLKFVAEQIQRFFGEELSFRLGGDEFAIFVPDVGRSELEETLAIMTKNIETRGYHVATGFAVACVENIDMDRLVRGADRRMYEAKERFYKNQKNDRRGRRERRE